MNTENRTKRGRLIEVIVKDCIEDNLFGIPEDLEKCLQDMLQSNLNFETTTSEVKIINQITYGEVYFENEDGKKRALNFSIIGTTEK